MAVPVLNQKRKEFENKITTFEQRQMKKYMV